MVAKPAAKAVAVATPVKATHPDPDLDLDPTAAEVVANLAANLVASLAVNLTAATVSVSGICPTDGALKKRNLTKVSRGARRLTKKNRGKRPIGIELGGLGNCK